MIWVLSYLITTDTDPEKADQGDRNKGFSLWAQRKGFCHRSVFILQTCYVFTNLTAVHVNTGRYRRRHAAITQTQTYPNIYSNVWNLGRQPSESQTGPVSPVGQVGCTCAGGRGVWTVTMCVIRGTAGALFLAYGHIASNITPAL